MSSVGGGDGGDGGNGVCGSIHCKFIYCLLRCAVVRFFYVVCKRTQLLPLC